MTAVIDAGDVQRLRALCRREVPAYPLGLVRAADVNAVLNGIWQELNEIAARRAKGGDVADLEGTGDSVPAIHERARMKAADLWGLDAVVAVEKTGRVHETIFTGRGRYQATVTVRCLNYAEIAP